MNLNEDGSIKKGIYRHFKGENKLYEVLGEARHSETLETLVVYKGLYIQGNDKICNLWVRPKKMFLEEAPQNEKNITKQKYRFEFLY